MKQNNNKLVGRPKKEEPRVLINVSVTQEAKDILSKTERYYRGKVVSEAIVFYDKNK